MSKMRAIALAGCCLPSAVSFQPVCADNLLRNSSFTHSANLATPDNWDLHHAAALRFRGLHSQFNLVETPAAPVADVRVLRIVNSEEGFPFVYLLSQKPDAQLPAGRYVFSVYAKSDRAGAVLGLAPTLDGMEKWVERPLTTQWRRYFAEFEIDAAPTPLLSPLFVFPDRASYWIAAPQLEAGPEPTAYAPALRDITPVVRTAMQRQAASAAVADIATALATAPGVNPPRAALKVDKALYQIRGVMVGGTIPPEWYFADIVDHGINTLFFFPGMDADGQWRSDDLDAVLAAAARYRVKVIVGPPLMGQKERTWKPTLDRYLKLVQRYRGNAAIIGWFVVDEPQAWTLGAYDLIDIYKAVKAVDPQRLVFMSWGSDDVPNQVGAQPHGTLAATDMYSFDYYPFANDRTNLETYTLRTIRALRTAALSGRPGHSWLQLYGYLDAVREPTGAELNYMSYVNWLFGGNYSYWQTKSNAKPTWDRLRVINREIEALNTLLTFNPRAVEVKAPTLSGRYLYAAWQTPTERYLVVLHVADRSEPFTLDLQSVFGDPVSRVKTHFEDSPMLLRGSTLEDSLRAYATRVYRID